ncbi:MAG: alcohol dehydrogenase catalytic domain-containing protein, partial [bacterium]
MKGLVLDAKREPRSDYALSEFERTTGKVITGSSVWRYPLLEIRDATEPKPGAREVLIAVKACGVCGSDMHFYETDDEKYIKYPGLTKFPCILGHEFS